MAVVPWKELEVSTEERILKLKQGNIRVLLAGDESLLDRCVVFLHGCDKSASKSENFTHRFKALLHYNFRVIAIDLPGYGKTKGKCHSFRTKDILKEGGPAECVSEVIKSLGLTRPILFGYDWGASIALRMGI